ncbi:MAG: hypothetical protein DMD96_03335 [Candidatus Rokuibacteriota bacterium]|nr:MAG: hypothetical protein DMD96_03335 [Candidatus Rokubacteria bacterium]
MSGYSGIILAGGDGTRLASLTRRLAGDGRPKQFCRLIGDDTLLAQTRRRARVLIAPERLLTVVTRHHERTDHYVSDDVAFMARVECALEAVGARPEVVVLLGIAPDRPEVEYGWIEPAELILGRWPWPIYHVRRFWEKPSRPVAERLEAAGCLWNCFVVVARPSTLEQLIRRATPELYETFAPLRARLGTPWEDEAARAVYGRLPSTDLSRNVFQACAESLAVLPVSGVGWTDLGDPARVHEAKTRLRWQPATA